MELQVTTRSVFGKKVNSLRRDWYIPGVIYGKHIKTPLSIQFEKNEFLKTYRTAWESTPVDLKGDSSELVLIHSIDTDPVSDAVIHVDFLAVKANEKVKASVEIVLTGTAPVEKEGVGSVQLVKDFVTVEAFPRDLPPHIEVDISSLATLQDGIFVSDLTVSDKVEILDDAEQPIVAVTELEDEVEETEAPSAEDAAWAAGAAAAPEKTEEK